MLEDLFGTVFDLLSMKSRKRGPVTTRAEVVGERVRPTIENRGKRRLQFAAVLGRDRDQRRQFPGTGLDPRTPRMPGRPRRADLEVAELRG